MPEHCTGLLCIGDPHLCGVAPGFRKDDFAQTILAKLAWSFQYARDNKLLPILLGDLFHYPRDNPNWMLVRLLELFDRTLAISGNHDVKENSLGPNDSLSILVQANALRLLDHQPWVGTINNQNVCVAGSSWGTRIPKSFMPPSPDTLVFFITHHDIRFNGYTEQGRIDCKEMPGIDCIINGHVHRDLGSVQAGQTLWINPGNITRVARADASIAHVPGVLRIDVSAGTFTTTRIPVPCQPASDVFHDQIAEATLDTQSLFIQNMVQLESIRTASGAGLLDFINANITQFDGPVADRIRQLAKEVLEHANV